MEERQMVDFSRNIEQIGAACDRYEVMPGSKRGYQRINLVMDLSAADGVNGNAPLDWARLLAADDFNFMHDVGGISRHMDRDTGKLGDLFVPRFTLKQHIAA
jgi:hypothetical protein